MFKQMVLLGTLVFYSWSVAVQAQSQGVSLSTLSNPASDQNLSSTTGTEDRGCYLIGPGDVLDVRVFGRPQLTRDAVRVDPRGKIRMPLLDEEIQASCRTEASLAEYITGQYLKYVRRPQVDVFIREYNSQPVAVVGAVKTPGRFQLQRQVRLLELLTFTGGPTERAGRTVQIVHSASPQACDDKAPSNTDNTGLSAYALVDVLAGNDPSNPFLRPGDVVSVLEADQVFVVGNVIRPSSIPLREPLTVSRAIAMSGGLLPYSKKDRIRIIRQRPGDAPKQEMLIDLKAIEEKSASDIVLQANDIVDVPVSSGKRFMGSLVGAIVPTVSQIPIRAIP